MGCAELRPAAAAPEAELSAEALQADHLLDGGALEVIDEVLRAGLMIDGRSFDPIARRPGEGWRTLRHRQLDPLEAAALVLNPAEDAGVSSAQIAERYG